MINNICPECGMPRIDCGSKGIKTINEIALEKKVERLQEKLEIAKKALKEYENSDDYNYVGTTERGVYWTNNKWIYPWRLAHKALKEMEGVK